MQRHHTQKPDYSTRKAIDILPVALSQRAVLHYFAGIYNRKLQDNIWPSMLQISKALHKSESSVRRYIRELTKGGWLYVEEGYQLDSEGRKRQIPNRYYLGQAIEIHHSVCLKKQDLKRCRLSAEQATKTEAQIKELEGNLEQARHTVSHQKLLRSQIAGMKGAVKLYSVTPSEEFQKKLDLGPEDAQLLSAKGLKLVTTTQPPLGL